MEKYVSNIKDLVIQVLTNGSAIKAKAESCDALSCIQMGMIHLLGVNTPIDFKKARTYFNAPSLSDDSDAKRTLGFLAECEGDFSESFKSYAKASKRANSGSDWHYIVDVIEERNCLAEFFKKLGLPCNAFNKEISEILNDYAKDGDLKMNACIRLATICNDESTCLEVVKSLSATGDYYSANKWLQKSGVDSNHQLYIFVKERLKEIETAIITTDRVEVIEINGNSLIEDMPSLVDTDLGDFSKSSIELSKQVWQESVSQIVSTVKAALEEERIRLQRLQKERAIIEQRETKIEEVQSEQVHKEESERQTYNNEVNASQRHTTGKFLKYWVDNYTDLPDKNGNLIRKYDKSFVKVHCPFMITGMDGKPSRIDYRVKYINGEVIINKSEEVRPDWNNRDCCDFRGFTITLGEFQIKLLKNGRYAFGVSLSLFDDKNNLMDALEFTFKIDYVFHWLGNHEYIAVNE